MSARLAIFKPTAQWVKCTTLSAGNMGKVEQLQPAAEESSSGSMDLFGFFHSRSLF